MSFRSRRLQKSKRAIFLALQAKHKLRNNKGDEIITPKIVSHKHKFICMLNPLVGSSTMRRFFRDYGAIVENIDLEKEHSQYKDYFKFAFIRNPVTRTISCYNKKMLNADTVPKLYILSKYKGLHYNMSLKEFIDWLLTEEGSDRYADRHWISQHKLLFSSNGEPLYDYLGKLETLRQDLNNICEYIGINIEEIPHAGSYKRFSKQYSDIDQDSMNKIYKRYYKDFNYFSYDKLNVGL